MKWYQNPKVLCFAGGVAAALVGAKVAKSPKTRELCVAGMAKGMKLQQDARVTLQNMKEDAQDLCAEAKQKAAQETAEEATALPPCSWAVRACGRPSPVRSMAACWCATRGRAGRRPWQYSGGSGGTPCRWGPPPTMTSSARWTASFWAGSFPWPPAIS